jgi:MoxR-like ATPase
MSTPSYAAPGEELERCLVEVKKVIVGQDHMIERLFVALLARGHVLLEGVPGVAKTLAVETLAKTVGGQFSRIQFTPDLVPSDIVGTRIYRPSTEAFDVELGPVFANFVLADEINRAPAKVQSALLEVMSERQVSLAGVSHAVPNPFLVLATQNPIESEGVYELPEAQRDRFLMKVHVGHPSAMEELAILGRMSVRPPRAAQILTPERVRALQETADAVFVHHAVQEYIVRIIMATRDAGSVVPDLAAFVEIGASPRGTLGLAASARALAVLRRRDYVLPQDVADVAVDVLAHRIVLGFEALADGVQARDVITRLVAAVPAPRIAPSQDETAQATTYPAQPASYPAGYPAQPQSYPWSQSYPAPSQPSQPAWVAGSAEQPTTPVPAPASTSADENAGSEQPAGEQSAREQSADERKGEVA